MKCLRINNEETSNTSRAITLKNIFQEKILKFGGYTLHISENISRVSFVIIKPTNSDISAGHKKSRKKIPQPPRTFLWSQIQK